MVDVLRAVFQSAVAAVVVAYASSYMLYLLARRYVHPGLGKGGALARLADGQSSTVQAMSLWTAAVELLTSGP